MDSSEHSTQVGPGSKQDSATVDPTKSSSHEDDKHAQQQTFTRRDSLRLAAGTVLGGIAAEAALNQGSVNTLLAQANQQPPEVDSHLQKKLADLAQRIPGQITAPDQPEVRTAIAGQLVVVRDQSIIIQVGPNAYELALEDIEDISDAQNPITLEREVGVTVVVILKSNRVKATTQVQNLVPRPEVPLALADVEASSKVVVDFVEALNNRLVDVTKPPPLQPIPESVSARLVERTQRWQAENNLLFSFETFGLGALDQCTIKQYCATTTIPIIGPPVCDKYDVCSSGLSMIGTANWDRSCYASHSSGSCSGRSSPRATASDKANE
jgi:hypothetical protein